MLRDQPLQTVETFIYSVEITSLGAKKWIQEPSRR